MSDITMPTLKDLTAYLLGRVPADEAERLDQLSITDDDLAEALAAAETDLIDAYVNGELSAADREEFEVRFLKSGYSNNRVAFAGALQDYAAARMSTVPVVAEGRGFHLFGLTGAFAAAAALLLVIAGAWLFISRSGQVPNERASVRDQPADLATDGTPVNVQMPSPNSFGNTQTEAPANGTQGGEEKEKPEVPSNEKPAVSKAPRVVAVILNPQLRSAGELRTIEVPSGTDQFSARLELEDGDLRSYRVVLRERSSTRVIWQRNSVRLNGPPDARRLALSIPARLLKPAVYTFTVSGIPTGESLEIVGEYTFKVVR